MANGEGAWLLNRWALLVPTSVFIPPESFPGHCFVHFLTSPQSKLVLDYDLSRMRAFHAGNHTGDHNCQDQHEMVLVCLETSLSTLDSRDRLRKDEIAGLSYGYLVTDI